MDLCEKVEINKPKGLVWAAITDIENCTNMISSIISLKILEKPHVGIKGLKWVETRKIFGKEASETMWITDVAEEEYYCTRAENHGAIYISRLAIQEVNGKTQLEMSFTATSDSKFTRFVSSIMGFFLNNSMRRMLQKDLEDIKTFLENQK